MDQQNQKTGDERMRAAIDVKLEEVVTLAISCGRSPEFITDVAPALRALLSLMVTQAVIEDRRASKEAFNEFVLARPWSKGMENPLPAAPQEQSPTITMAALRDWAVSRWVDEVKNRPLFNVYRRTLDDTWRQVIRFAAGDPDELVGPRHDDLDSKS